MPNLDVCGTIYPYPNVGDNPWGVPHIDWATAVSNCLTTLNTQVQNDVIANVFTTVGDMLYANPSVTPVRLAIGAIGQVLTVDGAGLPSWQTPVTGAVSVPIGSVIPWNDFNGVLTLDANYRYCDGSVIVAPGSPIDGLTTDDLSGAYIVGYGTLGGGDIGTVPYDVTPVGNPNHQISIDHTHTHTHTHNLSSHTHTEGTFYARLMFATTGGNAIRYDQVTAPGTWNSDVEVGVSGPASIPTTTNLGVKVDGTSSGPSTNTSGAASTPTTSSALSSTQSIQPRSQRYRYIIRVL